MTYATEPDVMTAGQRETTRIRWFGGVTQVLRWMVLGLGQGCSLTDFHTSKQPYWLLISLGLIALGNDVRGQPVMLLQALMYSVEPL